MKNANDKENFIALRAEGRSFADIADILKTSKPTLINWSKELSRDIQNARTLRMDELFEKYAVAKAKRVEAFGERLKAILAELDKRNLDEVPTAVLLGLALKYGESLKNEYETLKLQGADLPMDWEGVGLVENKWTV